VVRYSERSRRILEDNIDILHKLVELLLEKETVLGKELDELIYSMRPGIVIPSKTSEYEDKKSDSQPGQTVS